MQQFRKFFVYKRFSDELWGKLLLKSFSYTKKKVFLRYKKLATRRLSLISKYKYFKKRYRCTWQFLRRLKWSTFIVRTTVIKRFLLHKSDFYGFRNVTNKVRSLRFSNSLLKSQSVILESLKFKPLQFVYPNFTCPVDLFLSLRKFHIKNSIRFTLTRRRKGARRSRSRGFFYAIHKIAPRKKEERKSLFYNTHMYYKKFSVYYGFKKISKFVKYYTSKLDGWRNQYSSFLLRLECKLDYFLFRLNLFPSLYFVQKFINGRNVFVNNMTIDNFNYVVGLNEIISINRCFIKNLYKFFIKNLMAGRVLLNFPNFLEVDYRLGTFMLFKLPSSNLINRSFSLKFPSFSPYRL